MKIYTYAKCSTCRDATKWLEEHGIDFMEIPIREKPPKKTELRKMLGFYDGEIRRLFNSSGMDYRSMGLKDKLPQMSATEAIELLSKNGNLVKRPFLLDGDTGLVGFKSTEWETALG